MTRCPDPGCCWPSSAAASSGCRWRAGRRRPDGRCGCTAPATTGASWVAGGMLAPHSEGWPGEERLLRLGLESLRLWREGGFIDGLPPRGDHRPRVAGGGRRPGRRRGPAHRRGLVVRAGPPGGLGVGRPRRRTPAGARHPARLSGAHRTGGGQPRAARRAGRGLRASRGSLGAAGERPVARSRATRW